MGAAKRPEATSDPVRAGATYLPGAGAGPTLVKRSWPPSPAQFPLRTLGFGDGWREGDRDRRRRGSSQVQSLLLQVSPSAPLAEFARDGEGQGRSRRRGGILNVGVGVRNSSRLPPPLGRYSSPLPTAQASWARAQPDQLERIWAKEERGAPEPSLLSSAALTDWLCVPGAQLQPLQTPSETQGIRSAATQSGVGGWLGEFPG